MTVAEESPRPKRRVSPLGVVGLLLAMLAFVAAAVSPWAVEALTPKPEPIDEVAVGIAGKIKARLVAKAKGEAYVAPAEVERANPAKWYAGAVIGAGAVATCIGVLGLTLRHDVRLNTATIALGVSAMAFQYMLMIVAVILTILLVGFILSLFSLN